MVRPSLHLEAHALVMAVDCKTGDVLWETPNPDDWDMTHNSLLPMTFAGQDYYVYCGGSTKAGGVVGVSAKDGTVLWQTDEWRVGARMSPCPFRWRKIACF